MSTLAGATCPERPRQATTPRASPPLSSELDVRCLLVRRSDAAELVERFGEQGEQLTEAVDVLDDPDHLKAQLVDAFRELPLKPSLVVLHLQMDLGLGGDQLAQPRAREE